MKNGVNERASTWKTCYFGTIKHPETIKNGIPNYDNHKEANQLEKIQQFICSFQKRGEELLATWKSLFRNTPYYHHLLIRHSGLYPSLFPYGLKAYSQESIEAINRHLKQVKMTSTFRGLGKRVILVPEEGQEWELTLGMETPK